jgi:hypothetical protein
VIPFSIFISRGRFFGGTGGTIQDFGASSKHFTFAKAIDNITYQDVARVLAHTKKNRPWVRSTERNRRLSLQSARAQTFI